MAIKLLFGHSFFNPKEGMGSAQTVIRVKVKNVAPCKRVELFYRQDEQNWASTDLIFEKEYGSYDIFTNVLPEGGYCLSPVYSDFAFKLSCGGNTYWDNNFSHNYVLPYFRAAVGNNISLMNARTSINYNEQTSYIQGSIYVNDICFNKNVGVLYSVDGGYHWEKVSATRKGVLDHGPLGRLDGVEEWLFKTPPHHINNMPPIYLFSVFFDVIDTNHPACGSSFWDNNFDRNYQLAKNYIDSIE